MFLECFELPHLTSRAEANRKPTGPFWRETLPNSHKNKELFCPYSSYRHEIIVVFQYLFWLTDVSSYNTFFMNS